MPRKEGSPLTNNHSRSITTNDSSVAEDETLYGRHARGEPVNHRRSFPGAAECVEVPETELRHTKPGRAAADSSRLACIKQCAQLRCIPVARPLSPGHPSRLATIPGKCTISFANIVPLLSVSGRHVRTTGWLSARTDDNFYTLSGYYNSYGCARQLERRIDIPILRFFACNYNCEEKFNFDQGKITI